MKFEYKDIIFLLIFFVCGQVIALILSSILVYFITGSPLIQFDQLENTNHLRMVIGLTNLIAFVGPYFAFRWFYQKKYDEALPLKMKNGAHPLFYTVLVVSFISFLPLVEFATFVNQSIPLPDTLSSSAEEIAQLTKRIINAQNIGELLLNILVVGIIAGVGEELLFRGLLMEQLQRAFQNPWIANLVQAAIFSAIHFQFDGFLPRLVLGFALGYIYFRSRNILFPIVVHAAFNSFQVIAYYLGYQEINSDVSGIEAEFRPLLLMISIVMIIVLDRSLKVFQDKKVPIT